MSMMKTFWQEALRVLLRHERDRLHRRVAEISRLISELADQYREGSMWIRVAGVTFDGRQEIIEQLRGNERIEIVPEPSNQYDKYALAVWAHDGLEGDHIGYVPREKQRLVYDALGTAKSLAISTWHKTGGFLYERFGFEGQERANYGLVLHIPQRKISGQAPALGGRSIAESMMPALSLTTNNPDRVPVPWRCKCGKRRSDYVEIVDAPHCFECNTTYTWNEVLSNRLELS